MRLTAPLLLMAAMAAAQSGYYITSPGIKAAGSCSNGSVLIYDGAGSWTCGTTFTAAMTFNENITIDSADILPSAAKGLNLGSATYYLKQSYVNQTFTNSVTPRSGTDVAIVGNLLVNASYYLDMKGDKIVNMGTPASASDATTKAYVDGITHNATQLQGRALAATAPADGQAVVWDATGSTWQPGTPAASPGGSDTQIQYNNAGAFGGTAGLAWDGTDLSANGKYIADADSGYGDGYFFGATDTGIYEYANNNIRLKMSGTDKWYYTTGFFGTLGTYGGLFAQSGSTATNPAFTFQGDANTGVGRASADSLSLIAGAKQGLAVTSDGTVAGVDLTDGGTQPTCDATHRGWLWFDEGAAGVKDSLDVCAKDAADAYAWRSIY